jgi:hypothetical protein
VNANDRVLEQLRRQQGSYVVEDSEEKPSVVDIEGLKMCDNCGKANSKATQVRVVPDLGNRFDSTNLIPKNISTSP